MSLDVDLETGLLSKLITNPEAIRHCWDVGLRASAFEDPLNARIYQFTVDYWVQGSMSIAPTAGVIHTEFGVKPPEPTEEALPWLVSKLKTRYRTNQTQNLIREVLPTLNEDPEAALNMLYTEAWNVKEQTSARHDRSNFAESIQERRDRYIARTLSQNPGAPLGLDPIDDHLGGIRPGEVAALAGFAKTGKSMALVKSAIAARQKGFTPCVFTLELSIPEWEDRMDCHVSGVGYGKMQRAELDMDDIQRLHAAQEEIAELGDIFIERPELGDRTAVHMVNRARQLGADYIIIDQLSWMEAERNYRDRRDQYNEMIRSLKAEVSRTTHGEIPCLLAVQFNRESKKKTGGRGGMENIANSADVEQTVDFVFGLSQNSEMRANHAMVFDIVAARRADTKAWMLDWRLNNETRIEVREEYSERTVI